MNGATIVELILKRGSDLIRMIESIGERSLVTVVFSSSEKVSY